METCVIFCAGEFEKLACPIGPQDYILAADGGLRHLHQLGLTPDGIIGDFDSLGYVPENAQVFPVEKDDTDSMLAVRQGLKLGFRRFLLYGALEGSRFDHAIANLQTLQFLADHGATGCLIGKREAAVVIKNSKISFPAAQGILSVFCLGADAEGVSIRGLQYGLENGTLTAGYPLGCSNHFIGNPAEISVKNGSILIIYPTEVGIPEVTPC